MASVNICITRSAESKIGFHAEIIDSADDDEITKGIAQHYMLMAPGFLRQALNAMGISPAQDNAEWRPASEHPVIPRGEYTDCWVAISFEPRNYAVRPASYFPAEDKVIKLSWLNAELTADEQEYWDDEGELPDGAPSGLDYWSDEDGTHSNYTGWIGFLGDEEGRYRIISPEDDGYVADGHLVGRFRILAWQKIAQPLFPEQFSKKDK